MFSQTKHTSVQLKARSEKRVPARPTNAKKELSPSPRGAVRWSWCAASWARISSWRGDRFFFVIIVWLIWDFIISNIWQKKKCVITCNHQSIFEGQKWRSKTWRFPSCHAVRFWKTFSSLAFRSIRDAKVLLIVALLWNVTVSVPPPFVGCVAVGVFVTALLSPRSFRADSRAQEQCWGYKISNFMRFYSWFKCWGSHHKIAKSLNKNSSLGIINDFSRTTRWLSWWHHKHMHRFFEPSTQLSNIWKNYDLVGGFEL